MKREGTLEWIIEQARRPVPVDPAAVDRVAEALRTVVGGPAADRPAPDAAPPGTPAGPRRWRRWLLGRRVPLAAAAVLAALAFVAGSVLVHRSPSATHIVPGGERQVTFVLVEKGASDVALVGDFNDWDPDRTRMEHRAGGVWSTVVPLAPGRYSYAFVVDGRQWRPDPAAPPAADEDFGRPSSVVLVERRGT